MKDMKDFKQFYETKKRHEFKFITSLVPHQPKQISIYVTNTVRFLLLIEQASETKALSLFLLKTVFAVINLQQ